jgi:NADH-quinone oxidoreductase subunit L
MTGLLLTGLTLTATETAPTVGGGRFELLIPLIALLPLIGFIVAAGLGRRIQARAGRSAASLIPVGVIVAAWAIGMVVAASALFGGAVYDVSLYEWIPAGQFHVEVGFFVDNLTACLLIVVLTIGMLVHVYSIGYMSHDPGYWRFFAYLNLFMFSMLLLVLANNWLVVFVAWELVGLCSYLLIGFWYRKNSARLAAKKAFIVNRVGDVGFALGIMAIWVNSGAVDREYTLNIRESIEKLVGQGETNPVPLFVVALLVFAGAMGKSAQFPLHVWLPDAMEGPTPVSALIHAATMVNAGVYLVARASLLFAAAEGSLVIVAAIGIFTAILAASIAFTQTDIKRVLAYSTLSQLGYMFAALGVGAFTAAIFHLMTHGFFKGLLFLGSGSVIHAVHEEQDMRRMGGLSRKIQITYATMLVGSLAISGIPPLAGFFSKDEILGEAFKLGFPWVWAIGLTVAVMTAFYMFRLMGLTFWGDFRGPRELWDRIHESPPVMTWPLILLAIPSALLGLFLGLPLGASVIHGWLEPAFHESIELLHHAEAEYQLFGIDGALIGASVAVAAVGLAAAWRLFGVEIGGLRRAPDPEAVRSISARVPFLYRASLNKWWFDEINHVLFIVIGGRVGAVIKWVDEQIVDGIVNGLAAVTRSSGSGLSRVQTGRVQNYALGIAVGLLVVAGSYLVIAGR